jgi:hypothetical protein
MGMHSLAADLEAVHQRQAGAEGGEAAGAGGPGGLGRSNSRGSGLSGVEVRAAVAARWGAQCIAMLCRHGKWQHGSMGMHVAACSEAAPLAVCLCCPLTSPHLHESSIGSAPPVRLSPPAAAHGAQPGAARSGGCYGASGGSSHRVLWGGTPCGASQPRAAGGCQVSARKSARATAVAGPAGAGAELLTARASCQGLLGELLWQLCLMCV